MKLIKVKCKVCGKNYECGEGSIGEDNQLCARCWAMNKAQEIVDKFKAEMGI